MSLAITIASPLIKFPGLHLQVMKYPDRIFFKVRLVASIGRRFGFIAITP